MDTKSIAFLMLLLLPSTAVLLSSQLVVVKGGTSVIRVPNDFPTIQEAINAAQNGSTILVNKGVYNENLRINKTLALLGIDRQSTVIEGTTSGSDTVNIIDADNVSVNGFTVTNGGTGTFRTGIGLHNSSGCLISGNIITLNEWAGVELDGSNNNTVSDNIVSSTIGSTVGLVFGDGILLESSANNTISCNFITNSTRGGISLWRSYSNCISGNTIEENEVGVEALSGNNTLFGNNFIHNLQAIAVSVTDDNIWSASGKGNYWDDYTGVDDGSGGRIAGDGVGDTGLPWHGVDNFPLINYANPVLILWNDMAFPASLASNSTVSAFTFDQADKKIVFSVAGPVNTTGFFNVSLPAGLLSGPWEILLDGADVTSKATVTENQTYTTIYLNYSHSTHNVQLIGTHVIPEYPTATIFLLTILLTLLPTTLILKKKNKVPDTMKEFRACSYVSVRDLTEPASEVLLTLGKRIHPKLNRHKVLH